MLTARAEIVGDLLLIGERADAEWNSVGGHVPAGTPTLEQTLAAIGRCGPALRMLDAEEACDVGGHVIRIVRRRWWPFGRGRVECLRVVSPGELAGRVS